MWARSAEKDVEAGRSSQATQWRTSSRYALGVAPE